jgi:prepilin peptidase CpaA
MPDDTSWMLATVVLCCLCTCALWMDLRFRRIPNWLTGSTLVFGVAYQSFVGPNSLAWALGVGIGAFSLGLLFFALGGLGGGDVKLMGAMGVVLGPEKVAVGAVAMVVTGVAMTLAQAVRRGILKDVLSRTWLIASTPDPAAFRGWKGESIGVRLAQAGKGSVRSPYAVAIVAGVAAGWLAPIVF